MAKMSVLGAGRFFTIDGKLMVLYFWQEKYERKQHVRIFISLYIYIYYIYFISFIILLVGVTQS